MTINLFYYPTNTFFVDNIYYPLNKILFCFLWKDFIHGELALEVGKGVGHSTGAVTRVKGVTNRAISQMTNQSFWISH